MLSILISLPIISIPVPPVYVPDPLNCVNSISVVHSVIVLLEHVQPVLFWEPFSTNTVALANSFAVLASNDLDQLPVETT